MRCEIQLAWLRGRRALLAGLLGAVVGVCTRSRRISRATRQALLPVRLTRGPTPPLWVLLCLPQSEDLESADGPVRVWLEGYRITPVLGLWT
jgi:hypothetical protein